MYIGTKQAILKKNLSLVVGYILISQCLVFQKPKVISADNNC